MSDQPVDVRAVHRKATTITLLYLLAPATAIALVIAVLSLTPPHATVSADAATAEYNTVLLIFAVVALLELAVAGLLRFLFFPRALGRVSPHEPEKYMPGHVPLVYGVTIMACAPCIGPLILGFVLWALGWTKYGWALWAQLAFFVGLSVLGLAVFMPRVGVWEASLNQ